MKIGSTTIGSDGCLVCSLATLFQVNPVTIIRNKELFNSLGELSLGEACTYLGGKLRKRTTKLTMNGVVLAKTKHYAPKFPTHFFLLDTRNDEMIDPLDNPAFRRPNKYKVSEYIVIDDTHLLWMEIEDSIHKAEEAVDKAKGLRKSSLGRFIERSKKLLSTFLS